MDKKRIVKNLIKQTPIVLGAALLLAIFSSWLFHAEKLSTQSTENFYKMPSDIQKQISEVVK